MLYVQVNELTLRPCKRDEVVLQTLARIVDAGGSLLERRREREQPRAARGRATEAVRPLEEDDSRARLRQRGGRDEPGEAPTNHDRVRVHRLRATGHRSGQ